MKNASAVSRRATWCLLALMGALALSWLASPAAEAAAADGTRQCTASFNGIPTDLIDTPAEARDRMQVSEGDVIAYTGTLDQDGGFVAIDLVFSPLTIELSNEPLNPEARTFSGEALVGDYARFGQGIYEVRGRTAACSGNAFVILGDGPPWSSLIGQVGAAILGIFLLACTFGAWIPPLRGHGPRVGTALVTGVPMGLGGAILVQQAGLWPLGAPLLGVTIVIACTFAVLGTLAASALGGTGAAAGATAGTTPSTTARATPSTPATPGTPVTSAATAPLPAPPSFSPPPPPTSPPPAALPATSPTPPAAPAPAAPAPAAPAAPAPAAPAPAAPAPAAPAPAAPTAPTTGAVPDVTGSMGATRGGGTGSLAGSPTDGLAGTPGSGAGASGAGMGAGSGTGAAAGSGAGAGVGGVSAATTAAGLPVGPGLDVAALAARGVLGLVGTAALGAGLKAAAARRSRGVESATTDAYWFWVDGPTALYPLSGEQVIIDYLHQNDWHLAKATYDEWIHVEDPETGRAGFVAAHAAHRAEGT